MAPPKLRARKKVTPVRESPYREEVKPARDDIAIEAAAVSDELYFFTFQESGLTAAECSEIMDSFQTKEEFFSSIPQEDQLRFLGKVFIGRRNVPLKCLYCEKVYASPSGFIHHTRKCETISTESDKFRNSPMMWFRVKEEDQMATLERIVGDGDFTCFNQGCSSSFDSLDNLMAHVGKCVVPAIYSYKKRIGEYRKLPKKEKNALIRDAMAANKGTVACFVCGRKYSHPGGFFYHLDRCQLDESEQPWKCYRCGYEGMGHERELHLNECTKGREAKVLDLFNEENPESSLLGFLNDATTRSGKRRRTVGGAPRATSRKDGSTLLRFRKSTVNRPFKGIVSRREQKNYELTSRAIFDQWKITSSAIPFCEKLQEIEKSEWKPQVLDENDPFHQIFDRKSVTLMQGKVEGLQRTLPRGIQVDCLKTDRIKETAVAFCGAPINAIKVAPGKTLKGEDVVCVTTFANERDFESDSSVVQFWRHRVSEGKSQMNLWFLLHIRQRGTILSTTWLQKQDELTEGLIGFVAFSTTTGQVLIYRIDSTSAPFPTGKEKNLKVIVAEPHLILKLSSDPESTMNDESFLSVKSEEQPTTIDQSTLPILKIAWSSQNGGQSLAAVTALGTIALWNLDFSVDSPLINQDASWQSPPTDIAYLDADHIVVGFKERVVKVIEVNDWEVRLEENTMKTAGSRVHTDPRIVNNFFTFQSEYMTVPYLNATSVSYIDLEMSSLILVLIPTGNTHQLMTWDIAMCAPLGTLLSCGVDGRLIASATGRIIRKGNPTFFANRNLMQLRRRKILKEVKSFKELVQEVKAEESKPDPFASPSNSSATGPLEESVTEHEEVCKKMWLEVEFDATFDPGRPELSCRDQRIESLNCVDATTCAEFPVTFTGGEAGLLFAVPSKLYVEDLDI